MFYFQRKKELKGGLGADEMQRGSKKRSLIDEERAIHEAYQVFVPKEFFHLVLVQQFFKLQRAHTLSIVYKGIVYKGGFWAVLKILGKLRVPSTQAFQLRVFQRVGNS